MEMEYIDIRTYYEYICIQSPMSIELIALGIKANIGSECNQMRFIQLFIQFLEKGQMKFNWVGGWGVGCGGCNSEGKERNKIHPQRQRISIY